MPRRLMHQLPGFHVHPTLGAADTLAVAFSVLAMTPLQRVDAAIGQLTAIVIQLSGFVVASGILWLKVKEVRRATATERRVESNAQEIEKVRAEAAAAIAAAKTKADHAHQTARQIAAEASAKLAATDAAIASAVAAAKAERDAEIADLKEQLRQVRHATRDVANEVAIERQVRERTVTPDPDRSGPMTVIVANDPSHPVPTAPQAPADGL